MSEYFPDYIHLATDGDLVADNPEVSQSACQIVEHANRVLPTPAGGDRPNSTAATTNKGTPVAASGLFTVAGSFGRQTA